MKTLCELDITNCNDWTCPDSVTEVTLYEDRINYKIIKVTTGVKYPILRHEDKVFFGNYSIKLTKNPPVVTLMFISKP